MPSSYLRTLCHTDVHGPLRQRTSACVAYRDHVAVIDHESGTPVYAQLADILRAMIASGEIPADRPIPSVKTMMQTYGVAQGTAERAVKILKAEGLVKTVMGKGVYVI